MFAILILVCFEMFIIFNDIQRKGPMVTSVKGYQLQTEQHTVCMLMTWL